MIGRILTGTSSKSQVFGVEIDGDIFFEKRFSNKNDAKKELDFMQQLASSPHFPTIVSHDENTIVMKNGGTLLRTSNCPSNYKQQLLDILATLESKRIYHNDFWKNNLIVDQKTQVIQLIDFGWATTDTPGYPHMNLTCKLIENSSSIDSLYSDIWKTRTCGPR